MRDALLARRGHAYLEIGDYEAARRDFAESESANALDFAVVSFCLGRLQEVDRTLSLARDSRGSAEHLQLRGALFFALGEFDEAVEDLVAASRVGPVRNAVLVLRHISSLHLGRGAESPLHRWQPYLDLDERLVENDVILADDALILFLQGKISEDVMLAAAQESERSKKAEAQSYAFWVLAELARLDGNSDRERSNLEACIAAGAFTAIPHALALCRLEALRDDAPAEVAP